MDTSPKLEMTTVFVLVFDSSETVTSAQENWTNEPSLNVPVIVDDVLGRVNTMSSDVSGYPSVEQFSVTPYFPQNLLM